MPDHILSVHVADELEPAVIEQLRHGLELNIRLSTGLGRPDQAAYHVLVAGRVTTEMITASANLHTVIIPWAGVPIKTRDLLLNYPQIAVHNLHHNAQPTAEMAIALMMASAKSIQPLDSKLRAGDWTPRYGKTENILLAGKTALILGAGSIGERVAVACKALGMATIGIRKSPPTEVAGIDRIVTLNELPQVLPSANVLLVCIPLTDDTTGLIGEEELSLLPDNAIVVNISRGAVIREESLFRALESGRIRAGLDVWYSYPQDEASRSRTFPSSFPFHTLPNVVMTPHIGGESDQTDSLWIAGLQQLLNLAAQGRPLPNRVDLQRGY